MNNTRARFLPLLLLLLLGIATFVTLSLTRKNQELRSKAAADTGQFTFAGLSPASVAPGGTFSVAVNMNGSGQTVVGADVIVVFDKTKLTLTNIAKPTVNPSPVFKTYAPVDANGNFDTAKVITNAATNGQAEFGIVSFDWSGNALTSPNPSASVVAPVATLTFQVKTGVPAGTVSLSFLNNGINATTDSNIVVVPSGGNPEDILQPAPYTGSSISVTITGGTNPSPTPTATPVGTPRPTASPSALPSPTSSPNSCNACYNFNGTGNIDIGDVLSVGNRYGARTGDANYDPKYDVYCGTGTPSQNPDGVINIFDVTMLGNRYNQTSCTPP